jgi:hypothetical protein
MGKYVQQRSSETEGPRLTRCDPQSRFALSHPALWEHLTLDRWEDGTSRAPSSLTVFSADGLLKACLADKEEECVAFVSAESLEGLLDLLEAGLKGGGLDWRRSRQKSGKNGRN